MENHSTSSFCLLLFLLALSLVTVTQSIPFTGKDLESEESLWSLYELWRSHHTLSRDLGEKQKRFNVFKENVKFIHEFNQQDQPYKLALNKFADLTNREFRTKYAGSRIDHHRALRGSPHATSEFMYEKTKAPPSIDWRQKGAVTAVKDQGQCGGESVGVSEIRGPPLALSLEDGEKSTFYRHLRTNAESRTENLGACLKGRGGNFVPDTQRPGPRTKVGHVPKKAGR